MSIEVKDLKKKFLKEAVKEQHSRLNLKVLSGCSDEMVPEREYSAKYDCSPHRKDKR